MVGLGQACHQVSLSSTVLAVIITLLAPGGSTRLNNQVVTIRVILTNSQSTESSARKEVQAGRMIAIVILKHRGGRVTQRPTQTEQIPSLWSRSDTIVHQLNKRSKVVIIAGVKLIQSHARNIIQGP